MNGHQESLRPGSLAPILLVSILLFGACSDDAENTGATSEDADAQAKHTGGSDSTASGVGGSSNGTGAVEGNASGGSKQVGSGGSPGNGGSPGSQSNFDDDSIGYLSVYRIIDSQMPQVSARFDLLEESDGPRVNICETLYFDECRVTECRPNEDFVETGAGGTSASPHLDAGTITATSDDGLLQAVASPEAPGMTYLFDLDGTGEKAVLGEEVISFVAAGGNIDAFTAGGVIPLAPLITSPVIPEGTRGQTPLLVDGTSDFTFTWDRGDASKNIEITTSLPTKNDAGVTSRLSCRFESALGTASIRKEALALLNSGTKALIIATNRVPVETSGGTVTVITGMQMVTNDRLGLPIITKE